MMNPKYDRATGKRRPLTLIDQIKALNDEVVIASVKEYGYLQCSRCIYASDGIDFTIYFDREEAKNGQIFYKSKVCACGEKWENYNDSARKPLTKTYCLMFENEEDYKK